MKKEILKTLLKESAKNLIKEYTAYGHKKVIPIRKEHLWATKEINIPTYKSLSEVKTALENKTLEPTIVLLNKEQITPDILEHYLKNTSVSKVLTVC